MLSRNQSYFDRELCINGHYIITGNTNDQFCGDTLELTDILPEIHRYLRYGQEFDAVFFLDRENMLFCLDEQSFRILTGAPEEAPAPAPEEPVCADGPLGRRRRRPERRSAGGAAPRSGSGPLNLGRMSLDAAWRQVSAVMKQTSYRCALVIRNANRMQGGEELLLELSSFHSTNHSVVLYLFRETTLNNVEEWTSFARDVLLPRIRTTDPRENRVISLPAPNSREVRNLLNHLRFDRRTPLLVRAGDVQPLGEILSASCSRNAWGLVNLLNRLLCCARDNPGLELSLETWRTFTEEQNYRSSMEELEALVGQERVKEQLRSWRADQERQGSVRTEPVSSSRFTPLPASSRRLGQTLNVRLKGSPGTGKTTIARLMGRIYYELGLLPQGQLVECSAADLVSGYVGHTSEQVRQRVQEAMGGVLFIDEAYALMDSAHGQEAVNQLVNDMSSYEGQFAVVVAGYPRHIDALMRANDGLASRFPNEYVLEDYTPEEMQQIFRQMAAAGPDQVSFSPELEERMDDFFSAWVGGRGSGWANAREAQSLLVEMKKLCSLREAGQGAMGPGYRLTEADVPERLRRCLEPQSRGPQEAMAKIDAMIGLDGVKRFLRGLTQRILLGERESGPGNFIFSGPPGTGKTTVARQMGDLLGLLRVVERRTNNVTEVRAADLLNGARDLNEAVESARRGVFFLDEAHQLADSDRGRQIIRALVPLVEDPDIRADTCFICAGYTVEMERFLAADDGLERRFPLQNRIRFHDYTAGELVQILEKLAREQGQLPQPDYLERSRLALEAYLERRPANFGNGGFIRSVYLPGSIQARTRRLSRQAAGSPDAILTPEQLAAISPEERKTLTGQDLPDAFARLAGPAGRRPAESLSAWDRVEALLGKEEMVDFARARRSGGEEQVFFDAAAPVGLHYSVAGPPGCGRHTAVRALSALWKELGLLERDDVICAGKGDLEGSYVGHTAQKTRSVIQRAVGGTLVVESPSSLLPKSGTDNSFGPEALGELSAALGAHASDLCVVFLDSPEGIEALFQAQPGLRGQLTRTFTLEDLSPEHMLSIFRAKTRYSMKLEDALEARLPDFFLNWVSSRGGLGDNSRSWSNGAEVDRLIEDLKLNWKNAGGVTAEDAVQEGGQSYTLTRRLITQAHIPQNLRRYLRETAAVSQEAMAQLEALPGLQSVKASIRGIERRLRRLGTGKPGCYLYLGNPGVGKTTVARLMGGVLRAAGALSQGHVIERTARQMGDNLSQFDQTLKLARGGVLFIDEAHQLAEPHNYWGQEVIKRLLTVLEDDQVTDSTCIILAGYPQPMLQLIRRDEGLASRFGSQESILYFADYNETELAEVMDYMARRADRVSAIGAVRPLELDEAYRRRSREVFAAVLARQDSTFGNARFVRTYLHDSLSAQLERLDREYGTDDPPVDVVDRLTEADVPSRYHSLSGRRRPAVRLSREELDVRRGAGVTELTYDQACEDLARSVVYLELWKDGQKVGEGTGTIITQGGLVLTCAHVVRDAGRIRARVCCPGAPGGDTRWFETTVLEPVCSDCDMALLQLDGTHFVPAALRPAEEPVRPGEQTLLLGYPLGQTLAGGNPETLRVSNFAGRVASIQPAGAVERCFIDTTGLHGNSGSPVFSQQDRRVIGVFSGSLVPDREQSLDELNFFYPIRYLWERFARRSAPEPRPAGEEEEYDAR